MLKPIVIGQWRSNSRNFVSSSFIIFIFLTVFIYFTASVALIESTLELQNYNNIFKFICLISLIIYTVFSTVLYFRFVSDDRYRSNQVTTLQVNKRKTILIRLLALMGIITISMIICTIIPIIIFSTTERFIQITPDKLSLQIIMSAIRNVIILSPIASMLGFVAMRVGYKRKSIFVSVIAALIFIAFIGDTLANAYNNFLTGILILLFVVFIGLLTLHNLMRKFTHTNA